MSTPAPRQVTIRPEAPADSAGVRRLAALDSAPVPRGPVLLAEGDGRLLAAISLATGRVVADPFAPTAPLVGLLRLHAARPVEPPPERRRRPLGRRELRPAGHRSEARS
ncbi:MAG: hypothetical protein QOF77_1417 [Solirubrobacteraceae bacterium]|jgi:hypothetical protein|nr:hypothetical protein [Solirubrobacteraceae bacterium]